MDVSTELLGAFGLPGLNFGPEASATGGRKFAELRLYGHGLSFSMERNGRRPRL